MQKERYWERMSGVSKGKLLHHCIAEGFSFTRRRGGGYIERH
jgi:hypothetical protein